MPNAGASVGRSFSGYRGMNKDAEKIRIDDKRREPFVWVNLEFCNLDIDPASKAVYLEVVRRGRGSARGCDESVENIAHWANVSASVAKRSLRKLIEWGMIFRDPRQGRTSTYRVRDQKDWTAPVLSVPSKGEPGSNITQVKNDPGQKRPSPDLTQVKNDLPPGPEMTHLPGSNLTHELDPLELDPKTRSQKEKSGANAPIASEVSKPDPIGSTEPSDPASQSEPASLSKETDSLTTQTDLGRDESSAAAKKSQPKKSKPTKAERVAGLKGQYLPEFQQFWEMVPSGKKEGREGSFETFIEHREQGAQLEDIIASFRFDVERWKREGTEARFIPHPKTWLNKRRWTDENWRSVPVSFTKERKYFEAQPEPEIDRGESMAAFERIKAQMRAR